MDVTDERSEYLERERRVMDSWAETYDNSYEYKVHYYRLRAQLASLARKSLASGTKAAEARVLDVGCGTGALVARLVTHGFRRITGVDVSPRAIEVAGRKFPDLRFQIGSFEEQPFESDSFDVVTAFSSLHHLQAPAAAIPKVWDVLRSGGVFAFTEPDIHSSALRHPWLGRAVRIAGLPLLLFLRLKNADIWRKNREINSREETHTSHHQSLDLVFLKQLEDHGFERVEVRSNHVATTIFGPYLDRRRHLDRWIGHCLSLIDVPLEALLDADEVTAVFRKPVRK